MRILLLNTQMEPAGAQKALMILAQGLQRRGHHVVVVTMYDSGNYLPYFKEIYGIDIINLRMRSHVGFGRKVFHYLKGLRSIYKIMREEKIDVLQAFSAYSNIIGPLVALVARVPVRATSQRVTLRNTSSRQIIYDRVLTNSFIVQQMTAVSEGTRQFCIREEGIRPEKVTTIYNGIDPASYDHPLSDEQIIEFKRSLGLDADSFVIITVARLRIQKGHSILLRAIPQILSAFPEAHFLFAGEGRHRPQLEQEIQMAGLEHHVHLLGIRYDIPQLLAISDLFVLPSLWEGLPNALLEAAAAGVPAIASRVDGCSELIVDGVTGILVPPGEPEPLAKAVISLLADPQKTAVWGSAAKRHVSAKFSIESNIDSYIYLYERLLLGTFDT